MTNEERMKTGKFCLCDGDFVCDFHARGGFVTTEDNVKEEINELDSD